MAEDFSHFWKYSEEDMKTIKSGKTAAQILLLLAVIFFNLGPNGLSAVQAQVTCYTLTVAKNPTVGGEVSVTPPNCGSQYEAGTIVTLTATPNTGYGFWRWTGSHPTNQPSTINPNTITMDTNKSVTANFSLKPVHDDFGNAKVIGGLPYEDPGVDVTGASTQSSNFPFGADPDNVGPCENNKYLNQGNKTVWYRYTPGTTQTVTVDTIGSTYDTVIAVWTGTQDNLILKVCNDEFNGDSFLAFLASAGTTYYIQVAEFNGFEGGTPGGNLGGSLNFNARPGPIFADVPSDYWAQSWIESIYLAGITGGCGTSPLIYCPAATVNRDQMAVFLLRGIHGSNYGPPPVGTSTGFGDVPTNYWAAAWIKQFAAEGITSGCGGGNYCPSSPVTRAQMAVFLLRAKYTSSYTPPPVGGSTGFSDVPVTHPFAAWIKQLAAEGITSGCAVGKFCPNNSVTRDQMAIFLQRTFNLPMP